MLTEEILYYSGMILMIVTAVSAVLAIAYFSSRKRKLHRILEEEYGRKPK